MWHGRGWQGPSSLPRVVLKPSSKDHGLVLGLAVWERARTWALALSLEPDQGTRHDSWPCPLLQTRAREYIPVLAGMSLPACTGSTRLLASILDTWSLSGSGFCIYLYISFKLAFFTSTIQYFEQSADISLTVCSSTGVHILDVTLL